MEYKKIIIIKNTTLSEEFQNQIVEIMEII